MGVGGFNTFLMAKYAGAFKEVYAARKHYSSSPAAAHSQPQNNNVDPSSVVVAPVPCEHVFVDLNSVLHIALRRASTEAEFVQELFYQLDDIARVVTPIKTLVLAADGVGPYAKIDTQRRRRTAAARNGQKRDDAAETNGDKEPAKLTALVPRSKAPDAPTVLSGLLLTPGTRFSALINRVLHYWACSRLKPPSGLRSPTHLGSDEDVLEVVVSGTDVAGEGEVKAVRLLSLIQKSQRQRADDVDGTDPFGLDGAAGVADDRVCFVGGDSDLLLLSLCATRWAPRGFVLTNHQLGSDMKTWKKRNRRMGERGAPHLSRTKWRLFSAKSLMHQIALDVYPRPMLEEASKEASGTLQKHKDADPLRLLLGALQRSNGTSVVGFDDDEQQQQQQQQQSLEVVASANDEATRTTISQLSVGDLLQRGSTLYHALSIDFLAIAVMCGGNDYLPRIRHVPTMEKAWKAYCRMRRNEPTLPPIYSRVVRSRSDDQPLCVRQIHESEDTLPYLSVTTMLAFVRSFSSSDGNTSNASRARGPDTGKKNGTDTPNVNASAKLNKSHCVESYLEGIVWNIEMYETGQCSDSTYGFPYATAPHVRDVKAFLEQKLQTSMADIPPPQLPTTSASVDESSASMPKPTGPVFRGTPSEMEYAYAVYLMLRKEGAIDEEHAMLLPNVSRKLRKPKDVRTKLIALLGMNASFFRLVIDAPADTDSASTQPPAVYATSAMLGDGTTVDENTPTSAVMPPVLAAQMPLIANETTGVAYRPQATVHSSSRKPRLGGATGTSSLDGAVHIPVSHDEIAASYFHPTTAALALLPGTEVGKGLVCSPLRWLMEERSPIYHQVYEADTCKVCYRMFRTIGSVDRDMARFRPAADAISSRLKELAREKNSRFDAQNVVVVSNDEEEEEEREGDELEQDMDMEDETEEQRLYEASFAIKEKMKHYARKKARLQAFYLRHCQTHAHGPFHRITLDSLYKIQELISRVPDTEYLPEEADMRRVGEAVVYRLVDSVACTESTGSAALSDASSDSWESVVRDVVDIGAWSNLPPLEDECLDEIECKRLVDLGASSANTLFAVAPSNGSSISPPMPQANSPRTRLASSTKTNARAVRRRTNLRSRWGRALF
ncbi:XRN_N domain-containing protein [Pseudoscourfieldia marina]